MIFTTKLLKWYVENRRELPWRSNPEPYNVWLSEIILQQTRVAQGLPYYNRFKDRFPSVDTLATAPQEEVLKEWQGLGYYSRARNLHYAANQVINEFNGTFPKEYKELLKLKGVGTYTAAAIASICFNEPVPVVDGNVYRVLSRYFGVDTPTDTSQGQKLFQHIASRELNQREPGDHNQAIMEFGALQCTPNNPDCDNCPLQSDCLAWSTGKVNALPVKSKKTKRRSRYFHHFMIQFKEEFLIEQRTNEKDVWQGLYQLPLVEFNKKVSRRHAFSSAMEQYKFTALPTYHSCVKHVLSHQDIHASFHIVELNKKPSSEGIWVNRDELLTKPVSRLTERFLQDFL